MSEQVKIDFIDAEAFGIGPEHELWPVARRFVYDIVPFQPHHLENGFQETVCLTEEEALRVFSGQHVFVCEMRSGEIFAVAQMDFDQETALLKYFMVHPGYRGMGAGTFFLGALENFAWDRGATCCVATLNDAVDFFVKQGYIIDSNYLRKDL